MSLATTEFEKEIAPQIFAQSSVHYLRSLGYPDQEVDDILQNTAASLWEQALSRPERNANIQFKKSWIRTCIRNQASKTVQREVGVEGSCKHAVENGMHSTDLCSDDELEDRPGQRLKTRVLAKRLRVDLPSIEALSDVERKCILARMVGMDSTEMAQHAGCPYGSTRQHIKRAIVKIQKFYAAQGSMYQECRMAATSSTLSTRTS